MKLIIIIIIIITIIIQIYMWIWFGNIIAKYINCAVLTFVLFPSIPFSRLEHVCPLSSPVVHF
jgi:hypothetical protein